MTQASGAEPFLWGALGRCPKCGKGPLFKGFLSLTDRCPACSYELACSDSGDGPAVFVIIIVGFLIVFGALYSEITFHPPVWVHMVIWLPVGGLLCLLLLRPMKGLMVAAQIRNKASQHRRDEDA